MMKHYSKSQWLQYKKGLLAPALLLKMEEHLVQCDVCMQSYLSLIAKEEITRAAGLLSPGFSSGVMMQIRAIPQSAPTRKILSPASGIRGERRKNLLIYYTAAASITLLFMGGGLFQNLVDTGREAMAYTARPQVETQRSVSLDWPDKVVSKAAQWIKDFEGKGGFN